jgi:membrane fusion protein (multidrug efflux system)
MLRRRPQAVVGGLILLFVALRVGYLYWDYASHFEWTDYAFIAARQFAIAPKVSGYLIAVPVTDNEYVVAGQVIARIDDRDYRNTLAGAQAQVAAERANIENIDAQVVVQQAQIRANQAQVDQAQAALVFAQQQAKRYQELAVTGIAGTVQGSQRYTSGCDSNTLQWRVRKQPSRSRSGKSRR